MKKAIFLAVALSFWGAGVSVAQTNDAEGFVVGQTQIEAAIDGVKTEEELATLLSGMAKQKSPLFATALTYATEQYPTYMSSVIDAISEFDSGLGTQVLATVISILQGMDGQVEVVQKLEEKYQAELATLESGQGNIEPAAGPQTGFNNFLGNSLQNRTNNARAQRGLENIPTENPNQQSQN